MTVLLTAAYVNLTDTIDPRGPKGKWIHGRLPGFSSPSLRRCSSA